MSPKSLEVLCIFFSPIVRDKEITYLFDFGIPFGTRASLWLDLSKQQFRRLPIQHDRQLVRTGT